MRLKLRQGEKWREIKREGGREGGEEAVEERLAIFTGSAVKLSGGSVCEPAG